MLSCDICGETVTSEPDMKAHLLIVHMENEVICPFCKLSGVNYDEMCFHIETAHFEQNELERNFERINTVQYGTSDNRKDSSLQCRADINSGIHSACASNQPKTSAQSLPKDGTLKHKDFYSENLTESRKFLKSMEKQPDRTELKESIYETMYSPPECPFCGKIEDNSQDMETHVKTKHADLLDTPLEVTCSTMLSCDICGETVTSEPDMKAHLLIVHMENEVICPFCKLSGVNYDEMCFHIETAHFEQNELERNFERINTVQYGTSDNRKDSSLQYRADINSGIHSACASNQPKTSAQSLPKDGTLKHKDFYSENLTESRKFLKSMEKQPDRTELKESIYETMYSPPECPFCGKIEDNSQDMETHVKTKHADLLDTPLEDCNQLLYDCPMCGLICTNYHILQEHVDLHLEESSFGQGVNRVQCSRDLELAQQLQQEEDRKRRSEESRQEMEEFQKLQRQYGLDNSGGYKQQQLRNMEIEVNRGRMHPSEFHRRKADMMESLAIGVDDGKTKTSGVMEALYRYYQNAATDVRRVWLSAGVDHFHSSFGDKGWGCGYRNFQMLLSSLLQNDAYGDSLKDMSVPCIPKIQSMIEDAWKEGFDPQGASQLNNRLQGTKAWIGACEIYTLLTSLRIKCRIVDFHKSTGPLGTHPRLFEWILSYYASEREGSPKVVCTSKPPIYLQHQGHSRTIVGIEERKNRTLCLLVFDPGCPSREMQKLLKQDMEVSTLKQLRKFVGNLKHKQYQIVAVEGVLSSEEKIARRQASQVFTAEKIP